MEDEHCVITDVNQEFSLTETAAPRAFFAVFDGEKYSSSSVTRPHNDLTGHGGQEAATYAKNHLAANIFAHPQFNTDPRTAIVEAFLQTDTEFNKIALSNKMYCGTTAVAIIIQGTKYAKNAIISLPTDHSCVIQADNS